MPALSRSNGDGKVSTRITESVAEDVGDGAFKQVRIRFYVEVLGDLELEKFEGSGLLMSGLLRDGEELDILDAKFALKARTSEAEEFLDEIGHEADLLSNVI